jgi:superfamily II DNA or RNA helicase
VAQWVSELKIFLQKKSVDIFIYDSQTKGTDFWGSSGPMQHSKHEPHNKIIVASHAVRRAFFMIVLRTTDHSVFKALLKEMNNNFTVPRKNKNNNRPWNLPTTKKPLEHTLFGYSYLTVIIDEAHHMRNAGNKHTSALKLLESAIVRLIMTATPLHTSSKVSQICNSSNNS